MDFNRPEPTCYSTYFPLAKEYIALRVMRLTYTRGLIRFSNCAGLSRLIVRVNFEILGAIRTVDVIRSITSVRPVIGV